MRTVVRYLRKVALLQGGDGSPDEQLLEAFLTRRDETAFEALLRRHGPMVLGVCRRVFRDPHDAEDAFQATFLVLVRKAATIRSRKLLGPWLYAVAQRTALKARAMNAKRRAKEKQASERPRPTPAADPATLELLERLDLEVSRLPDKYRLPVVLCELQGKSRKAAAQLLGVAEGTLSWRLAQARKVLARRLAKYGGALPAGALAAVLAREAEAASVPLSLVTSTTRAAVQLAAGQGLMAGAVSASVIALTEGVVKAMLLSKLKTVWVVALVASLGAGTAGLTYRAVAAEPGQPREAAQAARPPQDELDELRLEIEALRKGLHATRERVKALESEVQALKRPGGGGGSGGMMPRMGMGMRGGMPGMGMAGGMSGMGIAGGMPGGMMGGLPKAKEQMHRPAGAEGLNKQPTAAALNSADDELGKARDEQRALAQQKDAQIQGWKAQFLRSQRENLAIKRQMENQFQKLLAEFVDLSKRLAELSKEHPEDKQAADALKRALQHLKTLGWELQQEKEPARPKGATAQPAKP